jgi:hypothetical protein
MPSLPLPHHRLPREHERHRSTKPCPQDTQPCLACLPLPSSCTTPSKLADYNLVRSHSLQVEEHARPPRCLLLFSLPPLPGESSYELVLRSKRWSANSVESLDVANLPYGRAVVIRSEGRFHTHLPALIGIQLHILRPLLVPHGTQPLAITSLQSPMV